MRKKIAIVCVAAVVALLSSCSGNVSVVDDAVEDINKDSASLFSYQESYPEFANVKSYSAFAEPDDLPSFSPSVSLVVFDCSSSPAIPAAVLDRLYGWLQTASQVWVLFCDAEDLSFFSGTKFDNEKHNYDAGGWYVNAYYNNGDPTYLNSTGYTLASEKTGREKLIDNVAGFASKVLRGARAEQ